MTNLLLKHQSKLQQNIKFTCNEIVQGKIENEETEKRCVCQHDQVNIIPKKCVCYFFKLM
jgi:hypothetical protein